MNVNVDQNGDNNGTGTGTEAGTVTGMREGTRTKRTGSRRKPMTRKGIMLRLERRGEGRDCSGRHQVMMWRWGGIRKRGGDANGNQ